MGARAGSVEPVDIYARVSKLKRDEKRELSTEGQVAVCRARLVDLGLPVGKILVDPGRSAWNPDVKRPAWDELMQRLSAGPSGGMIVFDLERFTRQPKDGERMIDLAAAAAAEAEVEAVRAAAEQRAATAEAKAADAERRAAQADRFRTEADAAAEQMSEELAAARGRDRRRGTRPGRRGRPGRHSGQGPRGRGGADRRRRRRAGCDRAAKAARCVTRAQAVEPK